jgi:peroxiredoxin
VSELYGVVNDRGNGCRRALFVVDREGVLRHVNRAYQVAEDAQYQALLDTLASIP